MTGNHASPGIGSRRPEGFMILTPSQLDVTAGEDFTATATVWPAGPRHTVTASAPDESGLRVRVTGHKVTVTGRVPAPGESLAVQVTVRDGTDVAHDTLTVNSARTPHPGAVLAGPRRLRHRA
ncbi:hypothetical protein ACH4ZX_33885 [Streptomyces sp. NPDC020490]|uniref:hypothetical protein n=1 Tax=Streptomyces sp. NPDC020490 TaxID=3365078 RepID=UPI00379CF882